MLVDSVVKGRYASAAVTKEAALCCPVEYDPNDLSHIPQEVIEKDYGCGNPARHVVPGDVVLDLGSGTGKACFIAAKKVGFEGKVIGVDFNPPMLELARSHAPEVAARLGYQNVDFRRGRIQDLALDLEQLDEYLRKHPVNDVEQLQQLETLTANLRREAPLIPDNSVSVVISNCVLNLVEASARLALFAEIFRVLKNGGRTIISDIVADEDVPEHLQKDPELWSGCISGAMREDLFLKAFEDAGFYGMEVLARDSEPWRSVEGIEFRSLTVRAWKGKQGPCKERRQAVIYKGPWREVVDDDGHKLTRGERAAVCDKTFQLYTREPYQADIIPVEPRVAVPLEEATDFDCNHSALRHPRETKGEEYRETTSPAAPTCCAPDSCC